MTWSISEGVRNVFVAVMIPKYDRNLQSAGDRKAREMDRKELLTLIGYSARKLHQSLPTLGSTFRRPRQLNDSRGRHLPVFSASCSAWRHTSRMGILSLRDTAKVRENIWRGS
jgi:hypothetical protein